MLLHYSHLKKENNNNIHLTYQPKLTHKKKTKKGKRKDKRRITRQLQLLPCSALIGAVPYETKTVTIRRDRERETMSPHNKKPFELGNNNKNKRASK